MNTVLRKIGVLFKRKRNAKKIGIHFTRASGWRLPQEILIKNKEVTLDLLSDQSTSTSFADIFLDDVYGLYFFKKHMPSIKRIVDIGANQGLFTVAASNVFPSRIHAYEPNPSLINRLKFNTHDFDVSCFSEAVGLTEGAIKMEEGKDSLHGKTILSYAGDIPQVSLQKVIARMNGSIDLLKLDCEGAEWEILQDAASLSKVKAITMEYHTDNSRNHDAIKIILTNAGFRILHYEISGPTWGIVWAVKS
ncbi:MAG TPA: FkbM family methyltransferase [Chitinophagaceae bacterium]|nr:FkbM family methyltransferase [Chitinophagaceae bacterium]